MNITAREIQASALAKIDSIITSGKTPTSTYRELGEMSGISSARIRFFHQGKHPNLSTETLDNLMSAIQVMERMKSNGK